MAFSRVFLSVNFPILFLLLQNNILNGSAEEKKCLNPSFGENQKIKVEFFFSNQHTGDFDENLCKLINKSNGLISIVYRMTSDMKEKATCMQDRNCVGNRRFACDYKFYQKFYDDCNASLPPMKMEDADCVCAGGADDILIENQNAFNKYKVDKLPAFVVDGKFDPCLTDLTVEGLTTYFCTAYKNKLPFCKK